jgi:hypothetical protein
MPRPETEKEQVAYGIRQHLASSVTRDLRRAR